MYSLLGQIRCIGCCNIYNNTVLPADNSRINYRVLYSPVFPYAADITHSLRQSERPNLAAASEFSFYSRRRFELLPSTTNSSLYQVSSVLTSSVHLLPIYHFIYIYHKTTIKMPRQRRGAAPTPARSAPTRPTAAPPRPAAAPQAQQQHQPHSTSAHPPQGQHAPPPQAPPQAQSSGPGLFGQMASTAA